MQNKINEYLDYLEGVPETKYYPLDLISKKISMLLMFRNAINKKPENLDPSYKTVVENNDSQDYTTSQIFTWFKKKVTY